MTFLQNPFQQKFSLQANDLFINTCLKKISITKSYQGKCKKAPLKFEIPIWCVAFNERQNVILTSKNSWRFPLPAVIAKKQHALSSGHGFAVVMSDWTTLFLTGGWCDVEHNQSKYRLFIPLGDWLFSPSSTLSSSTSWIHSNTLLISFTGDACPEKKRVLFLNVLSTERGAEVQQFIHFPL